MNITNRQNLYKRQWSKLVCDSQTDKGATSPVRQQSSSVRRLCAQAKVKSSIKGQQGYFNQPLLSSLSVQSIFDLDELFVEAEERPGAGLGRAAETDQPAGQSLRGRHRPVALGMDFDTAVVPLLQPLHIVFIFDNMAHKIVRNYKPLGDSDCLGLRVVIGEVFGGVLAVLRFLGDHLAARANAGWGRKTGGRACFPGGGGVGW